MFAFTLARIPLWIAFGRGAELNRELPGWNAPAAAESALLAGLGQALAPVRPRDAFRQDLVRGLAAVARQRRAPRIVLQRPAHPRRGILIGAAVSSAVSVAGLIAYFWHQHSQQEPVRKAAA